MARAPARPTQTEDQDVPNNQDDTDAPDTAVEGADSPVLDLSDAAVKRMIKLAKARGYVTLDELNAVLPSDETMRWPLIDERVSSPCF